ncbi:LysR substrate-binding domain-containing protein, partial [Zavarzinia sp.]|uniref:LysR substrate-binding domain-containing protein n=1 Tax=Zavarzinia sp. TaxID=2027920 RepID=UPI003BB75272
AQTIALSPPLEVNDAMAAVASAVEGRGVTCVLSYQADADLRAGRLVRVLADFEPPPLPVHLVYPESRLVAAKLRAFVDFSAPRLRARLASLQEPDAPGGG